MQGANKTNAAVVTVVFNLAVTLDKLIVDGCCSENMTGQFKANALRSPFSVVD